MRPVIFQCSRIIFRPATEISAEIANTDRWSEFKGYGILPGIESAEYESRTASMIGSRIRVRNTDGSRHVEEISKWVAGKEVSITLKEFTRPLSYVAIHFIEEWRFESNESATHVIRRFQMFASARATRPIVWLISLLFRRAIVRHLAQL